MADKIWIQLVVPIGSYRDATPVNAGALVSNAVPKQLVKTPAVSRAIQAGRIKEISAAEAKAALVGAAAATEVAEPVDPTPPVTADTGKKEEVKTPPPANTGKKEGEGADGKPAAGDGAKEEGKA